jgi:hypothetical protein
VEYADNGTGNGPRSRYYVHGVSYVDERLMMYDDDTDRPYYFVTDRMHNVRVLVDRAGAIRERYAYDPYGRPLIRELCGRGDMNNDTRMTTTPDDSRFAAAKDGSIWDPRADLDDDGDVDGADETAYHNKKPTWSSVMSAPTVSQAFSDFDNPYAFQGVPHFAIDTAANATSEQLNLALNHHRARFVDVQVGRWTTRDPLFYNNSVLNTSAPSEHPRKTLRHSDWLESHALPQAFSLGGGPDGPKMLAQLAAMATREPLQLVKLLNQLGPSWSVLSLVTDNVGADDSYEFAAANPVVRLDSSGLINEWCYDWTTDWLPFHPGQTCIRETVNGFQPSWHCCFGSSWPFIDCHLDQCGPACGESGGYCLFCGNQILCHALLDVVLPRYLDF